MVRYLLLLTLALPFGARADSRSGGHIIAVLPLDATQTAGKLSKEAQASLEEMLRDVAANDLAGWTVLTGETTLQVLADNAIDPTHCGDQNCHLSMAREIKAEKFISGTVQFAEGEYTASIRLIDTTTGRILSSARLEGTTAKDLRKQFESQAADFFARAELTTATPAPARPVAAASPTPAPVTSGTVEIPIDDAKAKALRPKLSLLMDGAGGYLAFDPAADSFDPFYWGTKDAMYAQRISGGGRSGTESFDSVFWEPRVAARWQGSFNMKNSAYTMQCGDKAIPLTPVTAADSKAILAKTKLMDVRWSRHLYALARDDSGTYYVVDQALNPEVNTNFRLFVGPKGHLDAVAVTDADADAAGTLITTTTGRLSINFGEKKAEWIEGKTKTPLIFLDVQDNALMAYTKLGIYRGEKLGTPCDGQF